MKVREEVRRLLDSLGKEIRTRAGQHSCRNFKGAFGCYICEMTRLRNLTLASLAYLRNLQLASCVDLFVNELELIELIGRDKVRNKMRYQVNILKHCPRKLCQNCGTEVAVPISLTQTAIGLAKYEAESNGEIDLLTHICKSCGGPVLFVRADFPKVDIKDLPTTKIIRAQASVRNTFMIRKSKDFNVNQREDQPEVDEHWEIEEQEEEEDDY